MCPGCPPTHGPEDVPGAAGAATMAASATLAATAATDVGPARGPRRARRIWARPAPVRPMRPTRRAARDTRRRQPLDACSTTAPAGLRGAGIGRTGRDPAGTGAPCAARLAGRRGRDRTQGPLRLRPAVHARRTAGRGGTLPGGADPVQAHARELERRRPAAAHLGGPRGRGRVRPGLRPGGGGARSPHRRAHGPAQPALLRRPHRDRAPPPPRQRRHRHPDGRHRPLQGPQRSPRPRHRRHRAACRRRGHRGHRARGGHARALRRRGVRGHPAACLGAPGRGGGRARPTRRGHACRRSAWASTCRSRSRWGWRWRTGARTSAPSSSAPTRRSTWPSDAAAIAWRSADGPGTAAPAAGARRRGPKRDPDADVALGPSAPAVDAYVDSQLDPDQPPYETRPRFSRGDPVPALRNGDLARIFGEIGDLLELKGEDGFKIGAYRRAADTLAHEPSGHRRGLPRRSATAPAGRGQGHRREARGARRHGPAALPRAPAARGAAVARGAAGGPGRRAAHRRGAVAAAGHRDARGPRHGRARRPPALGQGDESEKTEAAHPRRARGAARRGRPTRMHLVRGARPAFRVAELLETLPGVVSATPAGSVRRWRETIGDLDLLVETDTPEAVIAAFHATAHRRARRRAWRSPGHPAHHGPAAARPAGGRDDLPAGHARARTCSTSRGRRPTTCASGHARATCGWSLSEHGFARLGRGRRGRRGSRRGDAHLRHGGRGVRVPGAAVHRARAARGSGRDRGRARRRRCRTWCASRTCRATAIRIPTGRTGTSRSRPWRRPPGAVATPTRCSPTTRGSLTIANGLTPERVEQQRRIVGELNERYAREEASGEAPEGAHPDGFRLLHGCELEITRRRPAGLPRRAARALRRGRLLAPRRAASSRGRS